MELEAAWHVICESRVTDFEGSKLLASLDVLIHAGKQDLLRALVLERSRKLIQFEIVPRFWQHFENVDLDDILSVHQSVQAAIQYAQSTVESILPSYQTMDDRILSSFKDPARVSSLSKDFQILFNALLFNRKIPKFQQILHVYFSNIFEIYSRDWIERHPDSGIVELIGDDTEDSNYEVLLFYENDIVRTTTKLGEQLNALGWVGIVEEAFTSTIYKEIDRKIHRVCEGRFTEALLPLVVDWMNEVLLPWLYGLLVQENRDECYQQWKARLCFHMYEAFGSLRIKELFDIIKYDTVPNPALKDLKDCLKHTLQHNELVKQLKGQLVKRLLQPGANTPQVLDVYISTIKALRFIDLTGVLLEGVSGPVNEYLHQRRDTVRCVVRTLMYDTTSDLYEELEREDLSLIQHDEESDDDDTCPPHLWQPDPIEADPSKTSKSRSSNDLLSMLVGIYGSQEIFVNEYRLLLADRLIQNLDYNTDSEVVTHEFLKKRFGEQNLQQCEIMIKDIDDSKRVNNNCKGAVDATIVSENFWPPFQGDDFLLHPTCQHMVDQYKNSYAALKNPRALNWINYLGTVNLTLDFKGVVKEFSVSPIHATIIMYFHDQDSWTLCDLANKLELSEDIIEKKIAFWIGHGVLMRSPTNPDEYQAVDNPEAHQVFAQYDEADTETAVSSDAQEAQELQILESYIYGMLSNFGTLTVDRIHSMLTTFTRSGSHTYAKSIPELFDILRQLVEKEKLEYIGGQYQLHSKHKRT